MKEKFGCKIRQDLKESQIDWKVAAAFIPIAFATYIFHEFGHWMFGELLGNDMSLSLNSASPQKGYYIDDSGALWSAIGGPAFTILQGLVFLLITWVTKSIYAFAVTFFAVFSRFFSVVFGGIDRQDEAKIAELLDWNKYLAAAIVLLILLVVLWRCSQIMKFDGKAVGYFAVLGVFAMLVVIGGNELIMAK